MKIYILPKDKKKAGINIHFMFGLYVDQWFLITAQHNIWSILLPPM